MFPLPSYRSLNGTLPICPLHLASVLAVVADLSWILVFPEHGAFKHSLSLDWCQCAARLVLQAVRPWCSVHLPLASPLLEGQATGPRWAHMQQTRHVEGRKTDFAVPSASRPIGFRNNCGRKSAKVHRLRRRSSRSVTTWPESVPLAIVANLGQPPRLSRRQLQYSHAKGGHQHLRAITRSQLLVQARNVGLRR